MTARVRNIEPYLKLIGYGHLQKKMGGLFLVASIWCDELERLVDDCANKHLDTWVCRYVSLTVPFEAYYHGLLELQTLPIPLLIQAKAADLILAFKQTNVVEHNDKENESKCNPVSVQGFRGSNYFGV